MSEAEDRRDEAMSRVERAANEEWRDAAQRASAWVARNRPQFTSEDIRDAVEHYYPDVQTHELRAYGPVMQRCKREGLAEPRGFKTYERPSRHAAPSRIWVSLIYNGNGDRR